MVIVKKTNQDLTNVKRMIVMIDDKKTNKEKKIDTGQGREIIVIRTVNDNANETNNDKTSDDNDVKNNIKNKLTNNQNQNNLNMNNHNRKNKPTLYNHVLKNNLEDNVHKRIKKINDKNMVVDNQDVIENNQRIDIDNANVHPTVTLAPIVAPAATNVLAIVATVNKHSKIFLTIIDVSVSTVLQKVIKVICLTIHKRWIN